MRPAEKPTVLLNAHVVTMDEKRPRAEAIAFLKGRIICVGNERAVRAKASSGAKVLDAGGHIVLPGFIDCHTHFISMGVWGNRLDLSGTASLDDVAGAVKKKAALLRPGEWVLGRGWDEAKWKDGRYLDRRDLDPVSPDNPVMLIRVCGHMAALNGRGLALLAGKMGSRCVDRRSGLITEGALERARHHLRPSPEELAAGLERSLRLARRLGVTSVHDIIDIPKLRAYEAARCDGSLTVRACLHFEQREFSELLSIGLYSGWGGALVRVGGIKLYADGSFGARTAALKESYSDSAGNRGELLLDDGQLKRTIRNAEAHGIQLLIHAIGDRAVGQVVSAFSSALRGPSRLRHRIEHLELAGRPQLARMRKLGLWACMQPNFVGEWGWPGGMMDARLGKRYEEADAFRRVSDAGVPLIFGSDCMPFSPLYGISSAVNAPFPAQRISVEQSIACYTSRAASSSFEEDLKGSLSVGKAADMVVLSDDPFRRPSTIGELRVDATIFDGRVIWRRPGVIRTSRH